MRCSQHKVNGFSTGRFQVSGLTRKITVWEQTLFRAWLMPDSAARYFPARSSPEFFPVHPTTGSLSLLDP